MYSRRFQDKKRVNLLPEIWYNMHVKVGFGCRRYAFTDAGYQMGVQTLGLYRSGESGSSSFAGVKGLVLPSSHFGRQVSDTFRYLFERAE